MAVAYDPLFLHAHNSLAPPCVPDLRFIAYRFPGDATRNLRNHDSDITMTCVVSGFQPMVGEDCHGIFNTLVERLFDPAVRLLIRPLTPVQWMNPNIASDVGLRISIQRICVYR